MLKDTMQDLMMELRVEKKKKLRKMKTKYKKIAKALLDDYEMYREGYNRALKDVEILLSKKIGSTSLINQIQELSKQRHKAEKYT